MRPILFNVGPIPIYSYSTFVVIAFFACLLYAWLEARRIGEDTQKVVDLGFYMFIVGIFGSRITHFIVEWESFSDDPLTLFKIWRGGLVFYGGFILVVVVVIPAFVRYHKLDLWKWMDILAPVTMIALMFGRIGCFLNGCCYGKAAPEGLPWAVVYPQETMPLRLAGVPVHPAPIYASIMAAILGLFLIYLSRVKRYNGQVFWTMTLLYSIGRFILEYFRADPRGRVPVLDLTTSQAIGLLIIILSVCALAYMEIRHRRRGREEKPDPEAA